MWQYRTSVSYRISLWWFRSTGPLGLLCQRGSKSQSLIHQGQLYCHRLGQKTCQNTTTYQWTGWSSWWCYGILCRSKRIKKNATFCSPIGITSLMQPNCSWISRGELEYLRKPLGCNHTNRINGLHHFIHLLFVYNQNWFSWAFFYLNGSM